MKVTFQSVNVEWNGEGRKKWGKAAVKYLVGGKEYNHNVMSFSNPAVFKQVQDLAPGTELEVTLGKNDKGYDEWKSIAFAGTTTATSTGAAGTAASTRVSGSNYETREERAARQILIVKQNALTNAVETLSVGAKTAPDKNEVVALAQFYADWVLTTNTEELEQE